MNAAIIGAELVAPESEETRMRKAAIDNGNVSVDKGPDKKGNFHKGLTKREHFAAMAMQGMLADDDGATGFVEVAEMAVAHADALLLALEKVRP